jgi:hypothetical protein
MPVKKATQQEFITSRLRSRWEYRAGMPAALSID